MQTNHEPEAETQKTTRTRQRREWGGMVREQAEAPPLRSVVANVSYAEDKRPHKSHAARRVRSPDRHNQRKRNREDNERSIKVILLSLAAFTIRFLFLCLAYAYTNYRVITIEID